MSVRPKCTLCTLGATCSGVVLPEDNKGSGPKVMFIGEAPGEQEDREGKPFVGRSGTVLRTFIEKYEIDNYAIANSVRCRPPNNSKPTRKQINTCRQFLTQAISDAKPEFIVLLGAYAIEALTGRKLSVEYARGMGIWQYENIPCMATYHPAYLLRNPDKKGDFIEDMNRLATAEVWTPKLKITEVKEVTKLPSRISFDLETSGLDPYAPDAEILLVTWSDDEGRAFYSHDYAGFAHHLPNVKTGVGHNVKFDLLWLNVLYNKDAAHPLVPRKIFDTQVMAHLLQEDLSAYSLEYLAAHYTQWGSYKGEIWKERSAGRMQDLDPQKLIEYGCKDAAATLALYNALLLHAKKSSRRNLFGAYLSFRMELLVTLLKAELEGMRVEDKRLIEARRLFSKRRSACKRRLDEINEKLGSREEINWESTKQLGAKLTLWGYHLPLTKKGNVQVSEEAIVAMLPGRNCDVAGYYINRVRRAILGMREAKKMLDYIEGFQRHKDAKNRIHPTFKQATAKTGRLSCENPNMQNVPRDSTGPIKKVFVAPEGWTFVQSDFSQIELRIAALEAREEKMLKCFKQGLDLHQQAADLLFGQGASKEKRSIAKTINFAILYGAGPKKIALEAEISYNQAQRLLKGWYEAYPAFVEWKNGIQQELNTKGEISSMFGRKRLLPVIHIKRDREAHAAYEHAMRQACNFPIQSAAGDLTLMTMVLLDSHPAAPYTVGTVHDSIIWMVQSSRARAWAKIVRDVSESPNKTVRQFLPYWKGSIEVPTPVEIMIGQCWGEMEEWKG